MPRPPKILESILQWCVDHCEREALCGDFAEIYSHTVIESGKAKALGWYIWQICKLIPVSVIESIAWSLTMFSNYLKIAFRNMLKQKSYSIINISGLALGMAITILILLYIKAELSYDTYIKNSERIVRLESQWIDANKDVRGSFASLAPSWVPLLENDIPEFEHIVRMYHPRDFRIAKGVQSFVEHNAFYAEEDFFEVFSLPLKSGNKENVLKETFSIVLSESTSNKYFGTEDPIGKSLEINGTNYTVTGIMEDTPYYSHIHFDVVMSYISLKGLVGSYNIKEDYFLGSDNFSDNVCYTYALLAPNSNINDVQAKIGPFLDKVFAPREDDDGVLVKTSDRNNIYLRKLTDIHLNANNPNELEQNGNITYVTIFTIVAIFILIIACINFINLSTARGAKRAREVGLRKVVGAHRKMLITQFVGESMFIAFIGVLLAIALVFFALPYFEAFTGTMVLFNIFEDISILILLLSVFLIAGLVAGLYPAFYLSAFDPASILRGEVTKGTKGAAFRKVLVVFQFSISAALILCIGIIFKQMNYLSNADLGFNKENVLIIPMDRSIRPIWDDVKQNLLRDPRVVSATASKRAPSGRLMDNPGFVIEKNGELQNAPFAMPHNRVDYDFFKTYGMEIIAGRDLSLEYSTDDSLAYVVNQSACEKMGWIDPNEAIGKRIHANGNGLTEGMIVGVVKNFNYESLHQNIIPIITYISKGSCNTISVRIAPGDFQGTIDYMAGVFEKYIPGNDFEYTFLDDRLAAQYENEAEMMELFGYFSLLAIIIACLGLFGLAAFTAEQKTKEIGIRKVHGASVFTISFLLSKQFAKWVLIANIISVPVVYYFMEDWLNQFAYRADIGVTLIFISISISLIIAIVTVSSQTIKAALRNPAATLRTE